MHRFGLVESETSYYHSFLLQQTVNLTFDLLLIIDLSFQYFFK